MDILKNPFVHYVVHSEHQCSVRSDILYGILSKSDIETTLAGVTETAREEHGFTFQFEGQSPCFYGQFYLLTFVDPPDLVMFKLAHLSDLVSGNT